MASAWSSSVATGQLTFWRGSQPDGERQDGGVKTSVAAKRDLIPPDGVRFPAFERKMLIALCLGTLAGLLTFVAPAPFFPAMAHDLDTSVPLLGQVVAAMLLLSALFGLVAGPLADRYGHRRLILLGQAAVTLCFLAFALAPAFPVLIVAVLAGGFGNATVLGPSMAVAGTAFGAPRARRALGWATAAMAASAIVGVPFLSAIGGIAGWRLAFLVAAAAVIGIASLGAVWLPRAAPHIGEGLHLQSLLATYRPLLRHGATLRLYGVAFLRAVCWFGMLTYFGAFLGQRLGLTTGQIGLAYMFGGSGYFLGSLAAGGPLAGVPPRLLLIFGNVAMAIFMGIAFSGMLGPMGSVAMMPLATFAGAFGWVAVVALLLAESPVGAGTTLTLHGSLFNLGAAAGGAIGGLLLALSGYGALAAGLPFFGLAAALLAWWPALTPLPPSPSALGEGEC
jgi:DHA1 family inner membrane transport protein